ncbi:hypothetical protein Q1695_013426 [Nippostrongylus brasiliensis]|nr:hypothetical protein Q1695_013426 [Nippostrongylus brasiliensis]
MFVFALSIAVISIADGFKPLNLSGIHVDEVRGHELRELSLTSPYVSGTSFELLGNAYVSPNQIHLTENKPSEAGAVWSKSGVKAVDWEIMATLRITNVGRLPADGIAIWYTGTTEPRIGKAWGAKEKFKGIGVVLDTYVNDERTNQGQAVRLFLLVSTPAHDEEVDVSLDGSNLRVGAECPIQMDHILSTETSNSFHFPTVMILIRYENETLQVYYATYRALSPTWTLCAEAHDLFLPQGYRVGVSAATGDLYSAHSVISLRVFQISERLPDSRPQEVMFKGPYHTASAGSERDSDSHMDLWTFINLCIALVRWLSATTEKAILLKEAVAADVFECK